MFKQT